jgi:hypothetical protein
MYALNYQFSAVSEYPARDFGCRGECGYKGYVFEST